MSDEVVALNKTISILENALLSLQEENEKLSKLVPLKAYSFPIPQVIIDSTTLWDIILDIKKIKVFPCGLTIKQSSMAVLLQDANSASIFAFALEAGVKLAIKNTKV